MRLLKVPGQHLRTVELYLLHQGAWYEKPKSGNVIIGFQFRIFDEKHASYIILKYGAVDITEVTHGTS